MSRADPFVSLASIWARVGAFLFDIAVCWFLIIAVSAIFGIVLDIFGDIFRIPENIQDDFMDNFYKLLYWVLHFIYFVFDEFMYGATLGKALFKLRVVNMAGGPISLKQSLIRNIFRYLNVILFMDAWYALFRYDNRRLGDLVSETQVIKFE